MDLQLNGKRAFVSGSSKGIGRAIAEELAQLGAAVTLVSRSEETLQKAVAELPGDGHNYLVADYSDPSDLKEKVSSYVASNPAVHILINNTGGPPGGPITDAEEEAFRIAFNNHLICNHILATAFLPGMKEAGYGRIINVISTSVKQPLNGLGVSNTIRGAVASWSKTWANEVASFGITVNNVLPGATSTERLSSIIENKASKTGKSQAEVSDAMIGQIPARRFAQPAEVAAAAAFLASPAAAYINGINLPVDGGRTGSL